MSNLLVCRIKRDLDRNRSTKLFLEMMNPKILQIAHTIRTSIKAAPSEMEMIICDVQSATIEHLMHSYTLGEIGFPLYYLFDSHTAVMHRWMLAYIAKAKKQFYHLYTIPTDEALEKQPDDAFIEESPLEDWIENSEIYALVRKASHIIEDGHTLRLSEYRVLKFCLDNAKDAKRPLNGLHVYLGKQMGVVRSRCTKLFADACLKLRLALEKEKK